VGVPGKSSGAESGGSQGLQGFGEYDPVTGLYEYYYDPAAEAGSSGITWVRLLEHWSLIEADLHDRYGIDVELCLSRSWRWLRTRIVGLLSIPPAVAPDGTPIPATRIGLALNPPNPDKRRR